MRIGSIPWKPIRLTAGRVGNHEYKIYRDGNLVGHIEKKQGYWSAVRATNHSLHMRRQTFKGAVMYLARLNASASSDGPQDYGDCRIIRVSVASVWYVVVFTKHGAWVLDDRRTGIELTDYKQAQLRSVINEARKFAKTNGLDV